MHKASDTPQPGPVRLPASLRGCLDNQPGARIDSRRFLLDRRLRRVKRYVERNYAERLTLARVAAVAGLERSYFSRYFHAKTGACFHDWLRCLRVERAMRLMATEDLTITQLAFATGFRDLRTFERAFERCAGLCPRTARRRIRRSLGC